MVVARKSVTGTGSPISCFSAFLSDLTSRPLLFAERGDLEILEIIYEGAVRAKGEAFARQYLNAGAERGQTPLMRACVYG